MKNPDVDSENSFKATLVLCALGAAVGIALAIPATAVSSAFSRSARQQPIPATSVTDAAHASASASES